jgi:predicted nucleic acid-binding protein
VISAVDTNVIIDVLRDDHRYGDASTAALLKASAEGSLIASPVVWAEICAAFDDSDSAASALAKIGLGLVPDDSVTATAAGSAWRAYRRAGGSRRRVLPDFLIAAHAMANADRLVTRDRGFYRTYFEGLRILDPSEE